MRTPLSASSCWWFALLSAGLLGGCVEDRAEEVARTRALVHQRFSLVAPAEVIAGANGIVRLADPCGEFGEPAEPQAPTETDAEHPACGPGAPPVRDVALTRVESSAPASLHLIGSYETTPNLFIFETMSEGPVTLTGHLSYTDHRGERHETTLTRRRAGDGSRAAGVQVIPRPTTMRAALAIHDGPGRETLTGTAHREHLILTHTTAHIEVARQDAPADTTSGMTDEVLGMRFDELFTVTGTIPHTISQERAPHATTPSDLRASPTRFTLRLGDVRSVLELVPTWFQGAGFTLRTVKPADIDGLRVERVDRHTLRVQLLHHDTPVLHPLATGALFISDDPDTCALDPQRGTIHTRAGALCSGTIRYTAGAQGAGVSAAVHHITPQ